MSEEEYLGDGLYASFDGWHIRLRAPREDGDHWVAMEPHVYAALLDYHRCLMERLCRERADYPGQPGGGEDAPLT